MQHLRSILRQLFRTVYGRVAKVRDCLHDISECHLWGAPAALSAMCGRSMPLSDVADTAG